MPLLFNGAYAECDDKSYEAEATYYLGFQILSALFSINQLLSETDNFAWDNRCQYYHYYSDHLLYSVGQIANRFIISNKDKGLILKRKEMNRNNYRFSDKAYPIISDKRARNMIEQPIKNNSELLINMSYKRKLPGKNKLIQEETRYIKIAIRNTDEKSVSIDIRQPSSFDTQKALDILKKIAGEDSDSPVYLSHLNLELLTNKNKVTFFDKLSAISFSNWRLKTVTGITVKKSTITDDDDLDSEISDDEGESGTLAGINQAVLNGSGLRSNEFVQKSLDQGYYISSMKYRYTCTQEAGEFIVGISSKGDNLRVDMEKTYCDEDGTLYIQPFAKNQQDEIIRLFQKSANDIFYELISEQKRCNTTP